MSKRFEKLPPGSPTRRLRKDGTDPLVGRTKTHLESVKDVRALKMVERRAEGRTMQEVAEEFRCCTKTVERALTYAEKANLHVRYADKVLKELVEPAIETVKLALKGEKGDRDVKAALRVLEGTAFLTKGAERVAEKRMAAEQQGPDQLTLEIFLLRRQAQQLAGGGIQEGQLLPEPSPVAGGLPAQAGPDATGTGVETPQEAA